MLIVVLITRKNTSWTPARDLDAETFKEFLCELFFNYNYHKSPLLRLVSHHLWQTAENNLIINSII